LLVLKSVSLIFIMDSVIGLKIKLDVKAYRRIAALQLFCTLADFAHQVGELAALGFIQHLKQHV